MYFLGKVMRKYMGVIMQIYQTKDYEDMCRAAANIIFAQVLLHSDSVLGLATGATPVGVYEQLIQKYQRGEIDFSRVTSVNLDEYKGLGPDNPQSYRWFMQKNLFDHINILAENTFLPDGLAKDDEAECLRYNRIICQTGGIDLQLLGLGLNGHIGFNEPEGEFPKDTHTVQLTESTVQANKRFFTDEKEVPRFAYSMGIRSIMNARHILILVSGIGKADIVHRAFNGPVTPQVPASILQLHPHVTLVGDEPALSKLEQGDLLCG